MSEVNPTLKVVGVVGLKEVGARLKKMEQKLQVRAQKASLKRAAEAMLEAARSAAPLGPTGNLKDMFSVTISKRKDMVVATILNDAPHAHLVEWGHRIIGHRPNKTPGKFRERTAAHSFMRKALDMVGEKAMDMIVEDLNAELDKLGK